MNHFARTFKTLGPLVMMGLAASFTAGCDGANIKINGKEGVPLSELDMSGDAPTGLNLLGPDTVMIAEGDALSISVEGSEEVRDALRFVLDDGSLFIMRHKSAWDQSGRAVVNVTMPAPDSLAMGGSGKIVSQALASDTSVSIAGSGQIETPSVAASSLDVNIAGSGNYTASGTATQLKINLLASGDAKLSGLKADTANINIAGSGDAELASDGKVTANIVGSGDVTVIGTASCKMNGVGSGSVRCRPAEAAETDG